MEAILIIGAVQGLFLTALLLFKKTKRPIDRFIILWLLLITFHLGYGYWLRSGNAGIYPLTLFNSLIPFLQAPMLYLWLQLTRGTPISWKKDAVHFAPAALLLLVQTFSWIAPWLIDVFRVYLYASVPLYLVWGHWMVRKGKQARATYPMKYYWPMFGLVFIWLSFLVVELLGGILNAGLGDYFFISVTVFVYLIAVFLYLDKQPGTDDTVKTTSAAKYERSGLSREEATDLHQRLLSLMEEEKPFKDHELNLAGMAARLDIRVNHLSQIINEQEQKSFNEFVNAYRVKEFVRLARENFSTDQSILSMALEAGFRSKSSFNRIFKNETGMSPSTYLGQFNTD